MRGWWIALALAILISGVFALGVIDTPFRGAAAALFVVYGVLALGLILKPLMFKREHASGESAILGLGRFVGFTTLCAAVCAVVFFWTANEMTAEKIGRGIDEAAATLISRQT